MSVSSILEAVLRGDKSAISRAITILENNLPHSNDLYSQLYKVARPSLVIGVTGPPGAGKSTLVNCLVKEFRSTGEKVGVIAIDPTSPITGGALLGDRVRMLNHSLDEGVYIRSMASRGNAGGISSAVRKAIVVLEAAKYTKIIVETVGVGQTQLDIAKVADLTVVVLMPQLGDEVQAMKAGLMEIGDIFVVNKSDLAGADKAVLQILPFVREKNEWKPPVIRTSALNCSGVANLVNSIVAYENWFKKRHQEVYISKVATEIKEVIYSKLDEMIDKCISEKGTQSLLREVAERRMDPETLADVVIKKILKVFNHFH